MYASYPPGRSWAERSRYARPFRLLPDEAIVQPLAAQLGWSHQQVLLDAFGDDRALYEWYAAKAVEHRWSRRFLKTQIDLRLHERAGAATTNFDAALDSVEAARALDDIVKDPYVLPFLGLDENAKERDLEQALVQEFILDAVLRRGDDQESVGIILTAGRNETVAQLAMHRIQGPIAVSTWEQGGSQELLPPTGLVDAVPADQPELAQLEEVRDRLAERVELIVGAATQET